MGKTMTPSENITAGQIGKIQELLGAGLRKSGLPSVSTQQVLETQGDSLVAELIAVLRKRVEMVTKLIIRHVVVDRTRTPQEMINATGRVNWYIDGQVLVEMPRDGFAEGEVVFFELDYNPSVDELDREYEVRGLKPDPYAVAQVMTDDPAFADDRPVAVQWSGKKKHACYVLFYRSGDERRVNVGRYGSRWGRHCLFAGVRK